MQLMDFKRWIESLPGSPLVTQAAERAGIDRSTISRQLKRGVVSAENVIALARAYGHNEVDALVETGYVDAEAASRAGVPQALGYATNAQIYGEIMRRVDPDAVRLFRGGGDPDAIGVADAPTHVDDLAARRGRPLNERWAARDAGAPSEGELRAREADGLGEESQDPGDDL